MRIRAHSFAITARSSCAVLPEMRCNLPNMVRLTHIHERPGLVPEALWTFRVVLVNNNTMSCVRVLRYRRYRRYRRYLPTNWLLPLKEYCGMSQLCKVASLSLRLPTGRLERPRGAIHLRSVAPSTRPRAVRLNFKLTRTRTRRR